jgi:hypothetical protein
MQLDPTQFLHHLEPFEMSDAQKLDYVQAIIRIMQSFVDRAFGDAPEQVLLGTSVDSGIFHASDSVEFSSAITTTFNDAATGDAAE